MFSKKPSATAPQQKSSEFRAQPPLFDRPAERATTAQANANGQPKPPMPPLPATAAKAAQPRAVIANRPTSSSRATPRVSANISSPDHSSDKEPVMTQQPPKSASNPTFRSDFRAEPRPDFTRNDSNRRDVSPTNGPRTGSDEAVRKLIVGRDISLAGEISTCDYLIVEGTVEARVREGRRIEITDTGLFKGTVEIEEADIAGRFEGDINVNGRLRIRSTGYIQGKVQYGELEIEAGGRIDGEIISLRPRPDNSPKVQVRSPVMAGPEKPKNEAQPALTTETA